MSDAQIRNLVQKYIKRIDNAVVSDEREKFAAETILRDAVAELTAA